MRLEPEIEALFLSEPLLARHPRARWLVTPLGGITNRSYRLQAPGADLVLRWPGESASRYLDRSAEGRNAAAVAALGLAPPVLALDPARGWFIAAYLAEARPLGPADLADSSLVADMLGHLGRLHRADIVFPQQQSLFGAIDLYLALAPTPLMTELRQALEPIRLTLARHPGRRVPCHIDPNPANFLRRADGRLFLIDWEFAAMEEPLWDLAAVTLESPLPAAEQRDLLTPFIGPALWPRFELYRLALMLVAASWCEMELVSGNAAPELAALRDARVASLRRGLADPALPAWLAAA
ncbi:choline/ethanolamine kinase family protein [Dongia mobilis]|nr:choline/ethanolamine kinase family protein [Dongia mobilis]